MPLTQDLLRVKDYRDANPQLTDLSDTQLSDLVFRQTGELGDLAKSSALGRVVARGSNLINSAGQKTEQFLKPVLGDSYPGRVAARASSMAVSNSPEYLINLLAARVAPQSKMGLAGLGALNFGLGYGRTAVETGDTNAALGSGAGNVASLIGSLAGAKIGHKYGGRIGGAAGGFVGGLPGGAAAIATQPGGWEEFLKDPLNAPAYLLSQAPYAAVDHAIQSGEVAKFNREKTIAETPSLDDISQLSAAQEYIKLQKIPISQLPEQARARSRELASMLARQEEQKLAQTNKNKLNLQTDPTYDTVPESQASILAQIRMLNRGQKPAVMIPKGTAMPSLDVWQQGFKEHTNDAGTFLYDESKVTPAAIDDALKTNTLGSILGYGVPNKPVIPSPYTGVLRDRNGTEKMGVVIGDNNEQQVMQHLESLREPGDVVRKELHNDVIESRLQDRNKIKAYSLGYDPQQMVSTAQPGALSRIYTDYFLDRTGAHDLSEVALPHWMDTSTGQEVLTNPPRDFVNYAKRRGIPLEARKMPVESQATMDFSSDSRKFWQNSLLRKFTSALTPTDKKGARFQLDERGYIGATGARKAIEQWSPKEMLEHYKSAGLDTFLKEQQEGNVQRDYMQYNKLQGDMKRVGYDKAGTPEFNKLWQQSENIKNKYQGAVPTTLSKSDKVHFGTLADWIRNNTPSIEVKKLAPVQSNTLGAEADRLQHELETRGYTVTEDQDGSPQVMMDGKILLHDNLDKFNVTNEEKKLISDWQVAAAKASGLIDSGGDAATGRYGVEPIKVEEMDSPVDILVKVPEFTPGATDTSKPQDTGVLYRGPHFGESDTNVLASIRGYFQNLPTGERAFFPFEVQSDWGQKRVEAERHMITDKSRDYYAKDHPLLRSYETLAVKAAIQHALENGASKIVFPDSKTAMMTEGHDRPYQDGRDLVADWQARAKAAGYKIVKEGDSYSIVDPKDNLTAASDIIDNGNGVYNMSGSTPALDRLLGVPGKEPKQASGMKSHYDDSLPSIVSKLTNDAGKQVDMGPFTNKEASPYFKNSDGTPKDRITGRVYDLSNLKPEVENLFSMYGQQDQANYEQSLKQVETELEKALVSGADITSEHFIDAVTRNENVDKAQLLNYVKGLVGPDQLKAFLLDPTQGVTVKGRTVGQNIDINLKQTNREAFKTFGHEASHVAANQLKFSNPQAHQDLISWVNGFNPEQRRDVLKATFDTAGIEHPDIDYLAGMKFDPKDPNYQQKVAYEFMGGLSEVLTHQVFNDAGISPAIKKYLSWLPMGAQRWLTNLGAQFTKFFGPQAPNLTNMLDDQSQKFVKDAYAKLIRFTHANDASQQQAIRSLKKLDLFDEATFIDKLPNFNDADRWKQARAGVQGMGDMKDYALDFLRNSQFAKKAADSYEEWFMSPLFRTKLHSETKDFFGELHHYRNKIKNVEHGYMGYLGQDTNKTLSLEQSLQASDAFIQNLIKPGSSRNARLENMSKVLGKNNAIRDSLMNPAPDSSNKPVGTVTKDQLVTKEQMVKEYGLSQADANWLDKLIDVPRQVAEQSLRYMQATDSINLSKLFYIQNKNMDINSVKARVAELTRLSNDAGANTLEGELYSNYLERFKSDPTTNAVVIQELTGKLQQIAQKDAVFKQLAEQQIRQSFPDLKFDPNPGKDPFINQVTNVAIRLAKIRAEQAFVMRDEGYAPMTRRGRFLVQTFKQAFDGGTLPGTTESMKGFKTKVEADQYRKENNLTDENSRLMDKDSFVERAKMYTPRQLQSVRDKARSDFDDVIQEYAKNIPFNSPNRDSTMNVLSDIRNQFRPLDEEIKEVISAKGDKFKERRWNVPGFDELDFIPNIFEYTNYKTVAGQKALTRAEAELQILRPEVQQDPIMANRMNKELEYVLGHTSEWATMRKFVFYDYLGGSVRHMIQNLLQVPLNGIPEMFAQGAGFNSYSHAVKASALATKYLKDGTTGNKTFDVLLKQAEKEGVTIPNAIDFFAPDSSALQNALDTVTAQTNGTKQLGERASYAGTQFFKGFEKFMRSTAVASEKTNRQVSFLMSLLESERKGVSDPRKMFNDANSFTDYVNFVGDKSNRPGFQVKLGQSWAHAPVLVATALQSFVLNHISQLYAYGRQAMKGDINAQKAFATGTVHLIAMAGAMGLPLAQNAEQLFEAATGISLKEATRRKLIVGAQQMFDMDASNGGRIADTVLGGFPKLLGVEAGSSIGLGDPLFHVEAGKVPTAYDLAGPVGGLVEKTVQGLDAVTANPFDGDSWMKATRTVAPQALNYWLKLSDSLMKGGYYDRSGAPVVDNLGGTASVSLLGGFTPKEVADERTVQNLRRKVNEKIDRDYSTAVDLTAKALLKFQQTQSPEDHAEANKRFADYIDQAAGTQDRASMLQSVVSRLEQLKSSTQPPVSLRESQAFAEARSSYPDTKLPTAEQLPQLFDELSVAQSLGQDDILLQKIRGLKTSLLSKLMYDSLIKAGYEPYQASQYAQGGKSVVQKRIQTSNLPSLVPPGL